MGGKIYKTILLVLVLISIGLAAFNIYISVGLWDFLILDREIENYPKANKRKVG